jgi:hypothetical protein
LSGNNQPQSSGHQPSDPFGEHATLGGSGFRPISEKFDFRKY